MFARAVLKGGDEHFTLVIVLAVRYEVNLKGGSRPFTLVFVSIVRHGTNLKEDTGHFTLVFLSCGPTWDKSKRGQWACYCGVCFCDPAWDKSERGQWIVLLLLLFFNREGFSHFALCKCNILQSSHPYGSFPWDILPFSKKPAAKARLALSKTLNLFLTLVQFVQIFPKASYYWVIDSFIHSLPRSFNHLFTYLLIYLHATVGCLICVRLYHTRMWFSSHHKD